MKRAFAYASDFKRLVVVSIFVIGLSGCDNSSPKQDESNNSIQRTLEGQQSTSDHPHEKDIIDRAALLALAESQLSHSLSSTKQLQKAIKQLLKTPNTKTHSAALEYWHTATSQFEGLNFFLRLAEYTPLSTNIQTARYNIATWPIQPGYLDAFGDHAYSGLVFDIGTPVDELTLREQHGMLDKEGATLGFYALEYLLFGEQHLREIESLLYVDQLSDAHKEQGFKAASEIPNNRRRALIELQGELLLNDLSELASLWLEASNASRLQSAEAKPVFQHFRELQPSQLNNYLSNAARKLVADQMIAAIEQSQNEDVSTRQKTWLDKQLATRLKGQISGLSQVLEAGRPLFSQSALEAAKSVNEQLQMLASTDAEDIENTASQTLPGPQTAAQPTNLESIADAESSRTNNLVGNRWQPTIKALQSLAEQL